MYFATLSLVRLSGFAAVATLLSSCTGRPPTSTVDGIYSTTTGIRLQPGTGYGSYKGYPDDQAVRFRFKEAACVESTQHPLSGAGAGQPAGTPLMPGVITVTNTGLSMDEAEIPNQEWQQYQLQQESIGITGAHLVPQTAALPVADYYSNPRYHYFPVVGISYEQAQAFCRWRSQTVTKALNAARPDTLGNDYIRCTFRLPTEAEWEMVAQAGSASAYGTSCSSLPVYVLPKAAAYLKIRSGSEASVVTIERDIEAYNKTRPSRVVFNCQQPEPYFLRLRMPGWVYQRPYNFYGIYHLIGNAAEMVQERGLTKGGSYLDPLEACAVKAQGTYTKPSASIGFRCVAEVSFPNRK